MKKANSDMIYAIIIMVICTFVAVMTAFIKGKRVN